MTAEDKRTVLRQAGWVQWHARPGTAEELWRHQSNGRWVSLETAWSIHNSHRIEASRRKGRRRR